MLRDDFKFGVVLRRAMARAGIVEGYLHVCRKQGCRYEERAADDRERRCPEHGYRLWPKPLVRRIAFHHLRHTAGSLFLMAGVPLEVVQRMLRHTDPKITSGVYGHLLLAALAFCRRSSSRGRAPSRRPNPLVLRQAQHERKRPHRAHPETSRLLTVC
jgi:hypothetical protein